MNDQMPILVPVDDASDLRAVDFAVQLASILGIEVRAFSVVSTPAMAGDRQTAVARAIGERAVPIEVRVVIGDAVDTAIVEAAAAASTVCMTTAATLLPHEGHFGSIAESVVRSIGRPVVLLGPKASGHLEIEGARLVIPIDGSVAGEYVIDGATRLAVALGAEVWVVTVVTPHQVRQAEAVSGVDFGAIESGYVRRVAKAISDEMGTQAQFEVLHGSDPAAAILDFLEPGGLVAMSTHGRTGLARIFAGSVTTHVVAGSHQPVMVVRPPDHVLTE